MALIMSGRGVGVCVCMGGQVHQQASSASSAALEKKQEEVRGRRPAYDVISGESHATDCLP